MAHHRCLLTCSRRMVKQRWYKLCSTERLEHDGRTSMKSLTKASRFSRLDLFDSASMCRTVSVASTCRLVSVVSYVSVTTVSVICQNLDSVTLLCHTYISMDGVCACVRACMRACVHACVLCVCTVFSVNKAKIYLYYSQLCQ